MFDRKVVAKKFDTFLNKCAAECVDGDPNARSVGEIEAPKQTCNAPECCCDECWAKLDDTRQLSMFEVQP